MMDTGRIQYIKQRYGTAHLRRYMLYDAASIPERYWEREWSGKRLDLDKHRFVTVVGNMDAVNVFIAAHLRNRVMSGRKCLYVDFLTMLSEHVEYGVVKDGWLGTLAKYDLIVVGNVSYGETYDRHASVFPMILNSMSNTGGIKTIMVGMESVAAVDFEQAYGNHYVRQIVRVRDSVVVRVDGKSELKQLVIK